jgi:hypothetical protein
MKIAITIIGLVIFVIGMSVFLTAIFDPIWWKQRPWKDKNYRCWCDECGEGFYGDWGDNFKRCRDHRGCI